MYPTHQDGLSRAARSIRRRPDEQDRPSTEQTASQGTLGSSSNSEHELDLESGFEPNTTSPRNRFSFEVAFNSETEPGDEPGDEPESSATAEQRPGPSSQGQPRGWGAAELLLTQLGFTRRHSPPVRPSSPMPQHREIEDREQGPVPLEIYRGRPRPASFPAARRALSSPPMEREPREDNEAESPDSVVTVIRSFRNSAPPVLINTTTDENSSNRGTRNGESVPSLTFSGDTASRRNSGVGFQRPSVPAQTVTVSDEAASPTPQYNGNSSAIAEEAPSNPTGAHSRPSRPVSSPPQARHLNGGSPPTAVDAQARGLRGRHSVGVFPPTGTAIDHPSNSRPRIQPLDAAVVSPASSPPRARASNADQIRRSHQPIRLDPYSRGDESSRPGQATRSTEPSRTDQHAIAIRPRGPTLVTQVNGVVDSTLNSQNVQANHVRQPAPTAQVNGVRNGNQDFRNFRAGWAHRPTAHVRGGGIVVGGSPVTQNTQPRQVNGIIDSNQNSQNSQANHVREPRQTNQVNGIIHDNQNNRNVRTNYNRWPDQLARAYGVIQDAQAIRNRRSRELTLEESINIPRLRERPSRGVLTHPEDWLEGPTISALSITPAVISSAHWLIDTNAEPPASQTNRENRRVFTGINDLPGPGPTGYTQFAPFDVLRRDPRRRPVTGGQPQPLSPLIDSTPAPPSSPTGTGDPNTLRRQAIARRLRDRLAPRLQDIHESSGLRGGGAKRVSFFQSVLPAQARPAQIVREESKQIQVEPEQAQEPAQEQSQEPAQEQAGSEQTDSRVETTQTERESVRTEHEQAQPAQTQQAQPDQPDQQRRQTQTQAQAQARAQQDQAQSGPSQPHQQDQQNQLQQSPPFGVMLRPGGASSWFRLAIWALNVVGTQNQQRGQLPPTPPPSPPPSSSTYSFSSSWAAAPAPAAAPAAAPARAPPSSNSFDVDCSRPNLAWFRLWKRNLRDTWATTSWHWRAAFFVCLSILLTVIIVSSVVHFPGREWRRTM